MSKTVSIQTNPRNKPQPPARQLDSFVHGEAPPPDAPKERMKRLTLDVPPDLHKRIRRACLEMDRDMASELRRILLEHFPAE
jgi:hypothetical protein